MHGRAPVHVQMSASLKPNEKVETYETHGQQAKGHVIYPNRCISKVRQAFNV